MILSEVLVTAFALWFGVVTFGVFLLSGKIVVLLLAATIFALSFLMVAVNVWRKP